MKSTSRSTTVPSPDIAEENLSCNEVRLCGRVSGSPIERELPSGDKVIEFRLIISRDSRTGVDTLDIGAWNSKVRRKSASLKEGEWIELSGSIHRRFWQSPQGVASRWQVEAHDITRM